MKILLTNDDGFGAPGLDALRQVVNGAKPLVVAPAEEASGCSHSTTTDRPFRVTKARPDAYLVEGTPADCVRVAVHRFGDEISWVLAGINSGGNLGLDVYHSGTVAAVREAVFRGIPGIAVSHFRRGALSERDWSRAISWLKPLIEDLMSRPPRPGRFWNINLPHLQPGDPDPEVVFCPLDPSPLPLSFAEHQGHVHYDGNYGGRERVPGGDVDVCFRGSIAVTEIEATAGS